MTFFDSHAHCIKGQAGGLLIGLEGSPKLNGFLDNEGVRRAACDSPGFQACYYISKGECSVPDETFLKYHPRREKFTVEDVISDLKNRNCKLCVIDTLNQPYWSYLDFWRVISSFPGIKFILPHMGGYDIVDFVKILDFNKNVFCDFSMTQEYFGWCGSRERFPVVADTIDYCLKNNKLNNRILFGSDEPDFSQKAALEKYALLSNARALLEDNYLNLINSL